MSVRLCLWVAVESAGKVVGGLAYGKTGAGVGPSGLSATHFRWISPVVTHISARARQICGAVRKKNPFAPPGPNPCQSVRTCKGRRLGPPTCEHIHAEADDNRAGHSTHRLLAELQNPKWPHLCPEWLSERARGLHSRADSGMKRRQSELRRKSPKWAAINTKSALQRQRSYGKSDEARDGRPNIYIAAKPGASEPCSQSCLLRGTHKEGFESIDVEVRDNSLSRAKLPSSIFTILYRLALMEGCCSSRARKLSERPKLEGVPSEFKKLCAALISAV
ncbi:hypothetical protein L1887_61494 [Cichorium endivia]|nr:hypothetical protein L1887_61494 [Cichorium endivia]